MGKRKLRACPITCTRAQNLSLRLPTPSILNRKVASIVCRGAAREADGGEETLVDAHNLYSCLTTCLSISLNP